MIRKEKFSEYELYTISSDELSISVATLGATLTNVSLRGSDNLVLAYPSAEDYLSCSSYVGAVIGRYANRIAGSRFTLGGTVYDLTPNENGNQLHGGPQSFDRRRWEAAVVDDSAVCFTLHSPDGDNGFPGELTASVTYSVEGSAFRMDFSGKADRDTIYAPTTHAYWKLGSTCARDLTLCINSDRYLPVDGKLIPTGEQADVTGTEFDFRMPRPIGQFYDHCFILRGGEPALRLSDGSISMELFTDFEGIQMYTGSVSGFEGFPGAALEPEFCPDSPNRPEFESPVLRAGEEFSKYIEYRFE